MKLSSVERILIKKCKHGDDIFEGRVGLYPRVEYMTTASKFGHLELVKRLWKEFGDDLRGNSKEFWLAAMEQAIIGGHIHIVEYMIDQKIVQITFSNHSYEYKHIFTLSHNCIKIAIGKCNLEILDILQDRGRLKLYYLGYDPDTLTDGKSVGRKYLYEIIAKTCSQLILLGLPKYLIMEIVENITYKQFTYYELYCICQ